MMPTQTPPAPAPEAAPQPQGNGGGPISDLVMGINEGMEKLLSVLPEEDKAGLAQLIQGYQAFVQGSLGSGPAEQQAAPKAAPRPVQNAPEAGPNSRPVV